MNMLNRLIDLATIADGLVEGSSGGDAAAALAAALAAPAQNRDDRSDPSVQARMAEANASGDDIKRALLADDGSSSHSVSRGITEDDPEARREHREALAVLNSPEAQANIEEGARLLEQSGRGDAVADALTAKYHLDLAVSGFHANALTDELIEEDDWLVRGEHWAALTNAQRSEAVTSGVVDLDFAAELDQIAAQAREVVAQVDAEQSAERLLDGQVNVLARIADELHVDPEAFTENVLREVAERDGVNPASLSPKDLDSAVRMVVERDRREQRANEHAAFKFELVGSSNSVREGLTQAGTPVDEPYAAMIPVDQFAYDSLIKAVNARGAGSARAIRAGVAGRTEVDRGMQDFSALASKIAAKAEKHRGR